MKVDGCSVIPRVVLSLTIVMISCSCSSRTVLQGLHGHSSPNELSIWFVKPDGTEAKLIAAQRQASSEDKLETAVSQLLSGPTSTESKQGLSTEIPRGTLLLGIKQQGTDVELNLSHRFSSGGGSSSWDTRMEQLRRTVKAAAGDKKVYLDIEGKRLSTAAGDGLEIRQPLN